MLAADQNRSPKALRCSAQVFLGLTFLGSLSSLADACVLNGQPYRLASDTVRWSLELSDGENCIRGVRLNNVVIDKMIVVSAPQSGHVTLHGSGFSYKAAGDFQGHDFFSLMVSGATNKVPGSSMIEIVVSVSPPPPSPVDNLCGLSNGVAVNSAPTTNLCSTGTASVVSGSGPWQWSCSSGGTAASCSAPPVTTTGAVEKPGPSATLFAAPFYSCVRNFYVSPSGNDGAAGTQAAPWKTIQHADNAAGGRVAGDCVNVAPGTYATGLRATHGGGAATADGYVVYRCQTLNGCKITSTGGVAAPSGLTIVSSGSGPNFIVIDGFELAASSQVTYGVGVMIFDGGNPAFPNTSHHIWVINNIVHGFGQSGIDIGSGEYFYLLHNLSYNNSGVTCDAQGSGIGIVVPKAFAGYRPTSADLALGPFHNVVAWNVSHDNQLTKCGTAANPYDTDGNGIIMDTFNGAGGNNVIYPYQSLVAFNVTYRNGTKGIHVFRSYNVTVANNTAYDNNQDPFNRGQGRAEIDIAGGQNNFVINNIAHPVPATSTSDPRCRGTNPCYLMTNVAFGGYSNAGVTNANNRWSNNVSFGGSAPSGLGPQGNVILGNDTMNCSSGTDLNKCNANPGFADPAAGNFALTAASAAIGYGLAQSYLSSQSFDAGACDHRLSACP